MLLFIKQFPLNFMSCNSWWSTKNCAMLQSDSVMISIISSDIPLDFHETIRVVPLKRWIYFLAG